MVNPAAIVFVLGGGLMRNFLILSCIFMLLSLPAMAGPRLAVSCAKYGRNGQPAYAKVSLAFEIAIDGRNDERTIYDLRGEVRAALDKAELDSEGGGYIGGFSIPRVSEDPAYKPVKYKNSSKFPGVDAKETRGLESGMWGYLVVPRDVRGTFESHYIFQAGDHMGGTIHMSCRAQR